MSAWREARVTSFSEGALWLTGSYAKARFQRGMDTLPCLFGIFCIFHSLKLLLCCQERLACGFAP